MQQQTDIAVVILAAGQGKRMKNPELPKVLVSLNDKPLLGYVLDSVKQLEPSKTVIIIGHKREKVRDFCNRHYSNIEFAIQEEQLGTGHAVDQARENLADFSGDVLILAGDVPLLTYNTLLKFSELHNNAASKLSVMTTTAPDPKGYGRIVRDADNNFMRITEHKDADEATLKIDEINSGVFLADAKILFDALAKLSNNNAQGEYYLTDIIEIAREEGIIVNAFNCAAYEELQGVNSPEDLDRAEKAYNRLKP